LLLQELLAKGEEYELLLHQSEEQQELLMQEIAQMEVEYDRVAYLEWLATYVPPTTTAPPTTRPTATPTTSPSFPPDSSEPSEPTEPDTPPKNTTWLTPVPWYVLTSPFGNRFHPLLNIWRMHNGVDLACSEGTEIYASRSGVVTVTAYQEDGAGNYVQIDHGDGYKSIYMHMTHYIVSPGQYVGAGQVIGYVGSTGLSDGNHLHFGISYNGSYVNPMEYIS
jgi:murein DD-endopeptidase MepM/ murein hydrolase activator NlpD